MGPAEGEGLAGPSRLGGELLESLSRGCGQLRYLPGESGPLKAVVCRRDAVDRDGSGSGSEGLWAPGCGPGSRAGGGRLAAAGPWVVCPVCNGSPACSWSAGPSPSVHGRGRAGRRGRRPPQSQARRRRRQRRRQREPGALFLEQRQALRGRGRERGGDRGDSKVREGGGAAGGRPWPSGRRRLAQRTLPRAPAPRPEGLPA